MDTCLTEYRLCVYASVKNYKTLQCVILDFYIFDFLCAFSITVQLDYASSLRFPPFTSYKVLNQANFIDILKYSHRTEDCSSKLPTLTSWCYTS